MWRGLEFGKRSRVLGLRLDFATGRAQHIRAARAARGARAPRRGMSLDALERCLVRAVGALESHAFLHQRKALPQGRKTTIQHPERLIDPTGPGGREGAGPLQKLVGGWPLG